MSMQSQDLISILSLECYQCPEAMILGGSGVNENAEKSFQVPSLPQQSFSLRAKLTIRDPPKHNFRAKRKLLNTQRALIPILK